MHNIIEELNLENGTNYKIDVLKKHKDNRLLKRLLKMTYDKVSFTYGITMKNINYTAYDGSLSLEMALNVLENQFATRKVTGNLAIDSLRGILTRVSKEDAKILEGVIDRSLGINLGRTNINKVFKGLIVKPPYSRCDIGTEKNILKNMDFKKGVVSQVKMDGTYRSCMVLDEPVFMSRPGNEQEFPLHAKALKCEGDDFALVGEMTVEGIADRAEGNGMINSGDVPHEDVRYTVWDMIPIEEYNMKNGTSDYFDRFMRLETYVESLDTHLIQVVDYTMVSDMGEAYAHFLEVTKAGGEGTVIKAQDLKWKDGTSKQQLKVKLVIQLEMRFTSFNAGNRGSKNEAYFSGINFENDEGTIKGTIGVTTMTEKERDWFHENRDEVLGEVFEVECNDLSKSDKNDFHALSHPRYNEMRIDKNTTDTLGRAFELREMAMEVGKKKENESS